MKKTLVILAAGMGSRYGGLKQLDQIGPNGETIIDYSIFDAIRAGFKKVVFIIRRDIEEAFKTQLGSKYESKIEVDYAFQQLEDLPEGFTCPAEREKPWGTGHALLSAKDVVSDPFLVINADDFYGKDSYEVASKELENFTGSDLATSLIGFQLDKTLSDNGTVSRGLCTIDKDSVLVDVEEVHDIEKVDGKMNSSYDKEIDGSEVVSMNMWAFSPEVFAYSEKCFVDFLKEKLTVPKSEFYIPLVVNTAIQNEGLKVTALKTDSEWFGVTYKEDKDTVVGKVNNLIEAGVYPAQLW